MYISERTTPGNHYRGHYSQGRGEAVSDEIDSLAKLDALSKTRTRPKKVGESYFPIVAVHHQVEVHLGFT